MTGLLVSIEGIDGSGKSTLHQGLAAALADMDPLCVREPGGTPLGEALRPLMGLTADARTQLWLMCAARAELYRTRITPALAAKRLVVVDRSVDSSVAYQGGLGGLSWEEIDARSREATGGIWPDLTLLVLLDPAAAAARLAARADQSEAFESPSSLAAADRAFRTRAAAEPGRIAALDGTDAPAALVAQAAALIRAQFLSG